MSEQSATPIRTHILLTTIWLGSCLAAIGVVLSYAASFHRTLILLPEEVADCVRPLAIFYGSYLAVMLAFWYTKPFRIAPAGPADRFRAVIALVCAGAINVIILYFAAHAYLSSGDSQPVMESVKSGVKIGGWLSFLVAPANAFYFGAKTTAGS